MSELRYEPFYGRQVLVAPQRLLRPNAVPTAVESRDPGRERCPFCRGNESMTPTAVLTLPEDEKLPWQVRVVPNRYPALSMPSAETNEATAIGIHEVVIESAEHQSGWQRLSPRQCALIFKAYQHRLLAMRQWTGIRWGLIFKNQGTPAGASQYHVHSQVFGMSSPSPAMAHALTYASRYWQEHKTCAFCQLVEDELHRKSRVVASSENFVAFCPWASRFAFEVWIVPRIHAARFEDSADEPMGQLASFTASVLNRLGTIAENVAFNFAIHTAPFDIRSPDLYHWHLVICPRIAGLAGLELFGDVFINPVDPEIAASRLRGKI